MRYRYILSPRENHFFIFWKTKKRNVVTGETASHEDSDGEVSLSSPCISELEDFKIYMNTAIGRKVSGLTSRLKSFVHATAFSPNPALAYVGGWLGKQNLGDEALLLAVKKLFPQFSFWHFDGSRTSRALVGATSTCRLGLLGGGTIINRSEDYLLIAKKFREMDRRLMVFGSGVADPKFYSSRSDFTNMLAEWVEFLNDCEFVGVRGPDSAQLLDDAGLHGVEVVGDPVLAFALPSLPDVKGSPCLALNIGYDHGSQWGDPAILYREYLKLAKFAKNNGWRVKWLVVYPADLEITQGVAKDSGTEDEIHCVFHDPHQYVNLMSDVHAFVGMKLHATMLAMCAYVPSLMVEYDPKCRDFMKSVCQEAETLRSNRLHAESAWEHVTEFSGKSDVYRNELYSHIRGMVKKQESKVAELFTRNHA